MTETPTSCPFGTGDPFRIKVPTDVKTRAGNVILPAGTYTAWNESDQFGDLKPGSVCVWTDGRHYAGCQWATIPPTRFKALTFEALRSDGQTSPTTQRLTIVGPNLPAQAKATFHVHVEGCADLKRGWIRRYAVHADGGCWSAEFATRYGVEADVYDFAPAENEDYTLGDYQSDFYFAPCVTIPESRWYSRVLVDGASMAQGPGRASDYEEMARIYRDINPGSEVTIEEEER